MKQQFVQSNKNMEKIFSITLKNELSEISTLAEKLQELAETDSLIKHNLFKINLALDEIFTNIVSYGFPEKRESNIKIVFFKENDKLNIRIEDEGIEFNPLLTQKPDTGLSAEERKIGGLGIFFVKESMDNMDYKRKNEKNILTLTKLLTN